jgi:hypothetical protein
MSKQTSQIPRLRRWRSEKERLLLLDVRRFLFEPPSQLVESVLIGFHLLIPSPLMRGRNSDGIETMAHLLAILHEPHAVLHGSGPKASLRMTKSYI